MSLTLSELKKLYDLGFSLIYLHPREKRPIEKGWTSGPRATWAELKRDFNPSYNVGVRLGETSKVGDGYLCCIDVDVKDPKYKKDALKKLKEITKNVNYVSVSSGSGNGSRHLYGVSSTPFKMLEIEKHKDKWEICAYSTGRQMVLPPSIHPSGKSYSWSSDKRDSENFPKFSEALLNRSRSRREESDENHGGRKHFQAVDVDLYATKLSVPDIKKITDGIGVEDRSAGLLSLAMKMCRAGLTDNEILSVLSDENN
jgi:hypothetical protein